MKHLRSFREEAEYWITPEILQDLKDICLELSDIGLNYEIYPSQEKSQLPSFMKDDTEFYIHISNRNDDNEEYPLELINEKDWLIIEDCIERIKDYMKIHGYIAKDDMDEYGITIIIDLAE